MGHDTAKRLAARVARAARRPRARRILLLDLDGTLAPIAPTPVAARVPAATLRALRDLVVQGWRIAVVSGRPVDQLRTMVPLSGVRYFGSHGLEGSWSGRGRGRATAALRRRLATLAGQARRLAAATPGALVESKPSGLTLHDRRVPAEQLTAWRRRVAGWLASSNLEGLERLAGRRVLELRIRGVHKGLVVRGMPGRAGARPDHSVVAIGDDRTDEDLFLALQGVGLSVRVGRAIKSTHATARLPSPAAVQRFLRRLGELGEPGRTI